MARATAFSERRILVVEDDFFVAEDLLACLDAVGAKVVGPVASVREALDLIGQSEPLDGAVLDINLRGELAFAVADALLARSIPFVFATGYDRSIVPERFANVITCEKPFNADQVARAMWG